jgi:molecular chaperone DnaJ
LLKVSIPPGIADGNQLRLSGEGEGGLHGGPAGDLFVVVHIRPHEIFVRDGDHLICELPLTFPQAALGAEVEVPVLGGKTTVTVPPGTQPGQPLRVKAKGMPHLRGRGAGDVIYRVTIEVPTRLSSRQRELLEEYQRASGDEAGPLLSSFLDRMKKLFAS